MLGWEDGLLIKLYCGLPPIATFQLKGIPDYTANTFAYNVWNDNNLQKIFTLAFQPSVLSGQLSFGGIDPTQTDLKFTPLSENSTSYTSF